MADINNIRNVDSSKIPKIANSSVVTKVNNVKNMDKNVQQSQTSDKSQNITVDEALRTLKEKLEKLSNFFQREAQFIFDKDIDKVIIKIKDKDTGEIIRQIPPEVAVKIAKKVDELLGILFDELA
ncbi:MAG TPA: flagellar protein FlaG [Thermotogaceae bacterium]|nr:flagellar protein FlaG [Thermotogaceae bacterium]